MAPVGVIEQITVPFSKQQRVMITGPKSEAAHMLRNPLEEHFRSAEAPRAGPGPWRPATYKGPREWHYVDDTMYDDAGALLAETGSFSNSGENITNDWKAGGDVDEVC